MQVRRFKSKNRLTLKTQNRLTGVSDRNFSPYYGAIVGNDCNNNVYSVYIPMRSCKKDID